MSASLDVGRLRLGAAFTPGKGTQFLVWAPRTRSIELHILSPDGDGRLVPLTALDRGYFAAKVEDAAPGTRYFYRLDGRVDRPDPASSYQPLGVHGPSEVIDSAFDWHDAAWRGHELADYIIYELHVGTFTDEGTFESAARHVEHLADLGITAIELMPVAQFPGERNWGYDGVHLFAPQNSYGGVRGLKALVDACHARGVAVVLDVVYNHLGPEGNYLAEFGHYFTDRHRTPWGDALNFDGPDCDEVRRLFTENALYWITEYHIDALRLDAVHAIFDGSARPFLRELAQAVRAVGSALNRRVYTIAETNLNDPRLVESQERGGYELDALWLDDYQRALHALTTSEKKGPYSDFGSLADLALAYRDGFVLDGRYSHYRKCRYGASSAALANDQFVAFGQNHDQVGNRGRGERIGHLVDFETLKLSAAVVLLGPYVPMLFMGEEYAEAAPFYYFISHIDPALVEAVRAGRARDLALFQQQHGGPDPQDPGTMLASRLNHGLADEGVHRTVHQYCRELLRLRKLLPAIGKARRQDSRVLAVEPHILAARRSAGAEEICVVYSFHNSNVRSASVLMYGHERWEKLLDSADARWGGPGAAPHDPGTPEVSLAPRSATLFRRIS